jgi:hypothetical protein
VPVLQQGATDQWPRLSACCTLAGLVRLLRKVFSQLSAKNREFVTHSLKFEKNAAQQVRHSGLAVYLLTLIMLRFIAKQ